jgi:nitrogenase subunit NifH
MEGSLTSISCDPKSDICMILTSIPGILDEKRKQGEIADHLWKDRKLINAEIRDPESEWRVLIPHPG